jgi:site-specific DNA-methyltransferase (adenine-specific)
MPQRRGTSTSNFGVSRRESHDSSGFYDRFSPPDVSDDAAVLAPEPVSEPFVCGDARSMDQVKDGSVALVVTSPPYFAGKQYEEELERDGVPSSYLEYLELLRAVFAECVRKLEPGGRIAVNVANLGRKPYRSLSADVIRILQDDLGLLLRGEVIWKKGEGATGSCAWGSFRSPVNPVLRDLTERVVVASKGRFDRARTAKQRAAEGLPSESTLMAEDFMALTLDVWTMPTESARRVGHPAPFPVELPEQLIRLYTFRDDLVLDPFMGSGSTLVAADGLGRRFVGYDLDPSYVDLARRRVDEARAGRAAAGARPSLRHEVATEGASAAKLAESVLGEAGFTVTGRNHRVPKTGVAVSFAASDAVGGEWLFDVTGPFTTHRGGMARPDVVWRALGRASAVRGRHPNARLVLLTTELPTRSTEGDAALRAAGPGTVFDVIDLFDPGARGRLAGYAAGGAEAPVEGFWVPADLRG